MSKKTRTLSIAAALIAITVLVYAPVRTYDFVQIDDPAQVSENPHVAGGLTWGGAAWAFTSARAGYWMPLVWLSHMLDVQLYGMNAGPHHVTNLLLHIANTLLLFGLLGRATGALGRSAFVAALFAVHPLHVESVAWITERKDVLSTLFWMLTLWAYVAYVRKLGIARYGVVLTCFALGLMAKPMLVTLPFVLLLLDVWPLRRVEIGRQEAEGGTGEARSGRREAEGRTRKAEAGRREAGGGRRETTGGRREAGGRRREAVTWRAWVPLVREKLPLFALAAVSSVVVFLTQRQAGAVSGLQVFTLGLRVENALVSYVAYIGKTAWPARLAAVYPFPDSIPGWSVAGAIAVLAGVSLVAMRSAKRRQYLLVGWLWYLGTLVPVIGLVQVGVQAMADRFTYVPLVGLFIMVAWGVPDLLAQWPKARRAVPIAAVLAVLACTITARAQVAYWKDSVALWTHTTEVELGLDSYHAHMALGTTLRGQGRIGEAIGHFSEAVRLEPDSADAQYNLGLALTDQAKMDEAIASFSQAVRLKPDFAEAHAALGLALSRQGKAAEAIVQYEEALRLKPDLADVHNNLGALLAQQGKIDESMSHFSEAVRLKPDFELAHVNFGLALAKTGRVSEAVQQFREALRINPGNEAARRAVDGLANPGKRF